MALRICRAKYYERGKENRADITEGGWFSREVFQKGDEKIKRKIAKGG